ncbi:VOC family protein [Fulvivirga lutimaris]|uniref:VOC family protein n=1 Tax=Fulvivirga lutimaris TaxID=1819566 RepID=UPI0012BBE667|nr:VOC family protein [Fulvivirga lutimaris]MTI41188.1 bleomycin resistance family protein [Fulvivirga lutimaris]
MKLEKLTPNLMVEDVQQTINYYHGVLAFEKIDTVPENGEDLVWARMKKGEVEIMFQEEDSLKSDIPEIRHEKIGGGTTLFIQMTGIQEYYDYLYSSADVVVQMKETFYGMKEFTIRDINGYYLTFAEPI